MVTVTADTHPGHENPHFTPDGDCVCGCPRCSRIVAAAFGVEAAECVCPDCAEVQPVTATVAEIP